MNSTATPPSPAPDPPRATLALAALFLGTFVLGCSELLMVGVLDVVAADLHVTLPAAGALVSAYAVGLAIGGPVLTAATITLNRRTTLVAAIVLFALATLAPVLAPQYSVFVVARALAGALQGLFIGAAFTTATRFVARERAGRAISVIIAGVAVSAAVGVPIGTLAGHLIGWRGAFSGIVGLAVLAVVALVAVLPSVPGNRTGVAGQARHAFAPRVLAALGLNALVFASLYAALTYIVPFLREVTGITANLVSLYLLAYGAATAIGTFGGGRFADRNPARTLIIATAGTVLALLTLDLLGSHPVAVAAAMLAWGAVAFAMAPSLQVRVVSLAGPGGELASSLPASAINLGIATGPLVGGAAISHFGPAAPVLAAAALGVIAVAAAGATRRLTPPTNTPNATGATGATGQRASKPPPRPSRPDHAGPTPRRWRRQPRRR